MPNGVFLCFAAPSISVTQRLIEEEVDVGARDVAVGAVFHADPKMKRTLLYA